MAIALIGHAEAAGATSPTTTGIDTTGANLLVLSLSWYGVNEPVAADSKGNTWTALTKQTGGSVSNRLYYCVPTSVGSSHTFTSSGFTAYSVVCALAFSGSVASPYDTQNGNSSASASSLTTGSVTPSENNEVVIASLVHENNSGAAVTIDGGFTAFTKAYSAGVNEGGGIAYLIQTSAAAANPTWSIVNAAQIATTIASFKALVTGGLYPAYCDPGHSGGMITMGGM